MVISRKRTDYRRWAREQKKPTWWNAERHSTTSAYWLTGLPAPPGCPSSSHPTFKLLPAWSLFSDFLTPLSSFYPGALRKQGTYGAAVRPLSFLCVAEMRRLGQREIGRASCRERVEIVVGAGGCEEKLGSE